MSLLGSWRWGMRSAGCASLLCFALLCGAPRASAQVQSIAILGLTSDDDEALAASLTEALRSEAAADSTLRPSSSHASLSQMTMAQDCEITDAHCRARIGAALSVQQVLYGEVRRRGSGSYEVEVHMFAAKGGAQVSAKRPVPAGRTSRFDLAEQAKALLRALRGGPEEHMDSDGPPPLATVAPDVQPLGQAPPDTSEPAPKKGGAVRQEWIAYGLFGLAGISFGLTVLSWAEISSAGGDKNLEAYRKAVGVMNPSSSDACDDADKKRTYGVDAATLSGARSACDSGRTFERLQYVFLGAALVSVGVGTYFLVDAQHRAKGQSGGLEVTLRPTFGRDSASLRLRFQL